MPEFRQDYLSGEWVCIATERERRPQSFKEKEENGFLNNEHCPFCQKNSSMLPDIIFESLNKRVKVIPNKYPVVSDDSFMGFGNHEVLIDTPNHMEKLAFFCDDDFFTVIKTIKDRVVCLSKLDKIKYVQVFKNDGKKAGASIYHSHWQIVALSIIPTKQENINKNFFRYKEQHNSCYLCDEIEKIKNNIVTQNENFVAFVPHASIYSYSVNIVCKKHCSGIEYFDDNMIKDLACIMKKVLQSLGNIIKDISYNICFQNKLCDDKDTNHFYLQIIPRIGYIAGFEFSTGCYINSIDPIVATEKLKQSILL